MKDSIRELQLRAKGWGSQKSGGEARDVPGASPPVRRNGVGKTSPLESVRYRRPIRTSTWWVAPSRKSGSRLPWISRPSTLTWATPLEM